MIQQPTVVVTLKIDGIDCGARPGETIMEIARENGIEIPGLCNLDGLEPVGACRLCLVEIVGQKKLQAACMTTAAEGMEILTQTERLKNYRRGIIELLFSERNHICSVCVTNGHCELQWTAQKQGMNHVRLPYLNQKLSVDASHERFVMDHNRCILCTRCIRVCDAVEGAHTKDILGRGVNCRIINDLNQPWGDSATCTSCGKCVNVCPTGALVEKGKSVAEMKKHKQFLPYLQQMRGRHHG